MQDLLKGLHHPRLPLRHAWIIGKHLANRCHAERVTLRDVAISWLRHVAQQEIARALQRLVCALCIAAFEQLHFLQLRHRQRKLTQRKGDLLKADLLRCVIAIHHSLVAAQDDVLRECEQFLVVRLPPRQQQPRDDHDFTTAHHGDRLVLRSIENLADHDLGTPERNSFAEPGHRSGAIFVLGGGERGRRTK